MKVPRAQPESGRVDKPRRQNRRGEGELLRDEIVLATRRLLERSGTESAVSLRAVAREAGITAPAIYPHFAGPNELIEAAITSIWVEALTELEAARAAAGASVGPRDIIRIRCWVYIGFARRNPASYQIVFTRPDPSAMPDVRRLAMNDHMEFLRVLAAALPELSVAEVAVRGTIFWTALHGLAVLPPFNPRFPWPDTAVLIEDLLNTQLGVERS